VFFFFICCKAHQITMDTSVVDLNIKLAAIYYNEGKSHQLRVHNDITLFRLKNQLDQINRQLNHRDTRRMDDVDYRLPSIDSARWSSWMTTMWEPHCNTLNSKNDKLRQWYEHNKNLDVTSPINHQTWINNNFLKTSQRNKNIITSTFNKIISTVIHNK